MAKHRKNRSGGSVLKDNRKKKFRAQDPESKRVEIVAEGANAPPKDDEDIVGIPKMVGAPCLPMDIGQPVSVQLHEGALGPRGTGDADKLSGRQQRREKKKKAKEVSAATGGAKAGAKDKVGKDSAPKEAPTISQDLPKQRPGESARAYSARVDQSLRSKLQEASRKVPTAHHREKMRTRAADKRKRARDRKGKAKAEAAEEAKAEKVEFGDVVERPPILSSAVMKSRSKLKKKTEEAAKVLVSGTGLIKEAQSNAPADLADYAAKVREAYAAMKKQRLAGSR